MMWKIGLAKTGKSVYICSIEPFADGRCKWLEDNNKNINRYGKD